MEKEEINFLVKSALTEVLGSLAPKTAKLISRNQLCEILGVSLPTLDKWTKKGEFNRLIVGGRIRYNLEEVMSAIEKRNNH